MLTPNQVKNHTFTSVKGMYQMNEVDAFMGEIIASYEQMFKENGELLDKLQMLVKKVDEYRRDEDKIKDALIVAQKAASQITGEAEEKAKFTLNDATAQAEALTSKTRQETDQLLEETRREREETLSKAEATANEVIEGAKVLAENVISQAKYSSEEIITKAKVEVELNQRILNELKSAAATFKADLLEKYHQHIETINTIPDTLSQEIEARIAAEKEAIEAEHAKEEAAAQADTEKTASIVEVDEPVQPPVKEPEAEEVQPESDVALPDEAPEQDVASYETSVLETQAENPNFQESEPEFSTSGEEFPLEEPRRRSVLPQLNDEELKFGEDYDISDDMDDYDDEEEESKGFKGFFRRKK